MDYHPGASRPKSEREDSYTNRERERENKNYDNTKKQTHRTHIKDVIVTFARS